MSFCGGAAVSLVTLVVMPEEPVRFGVLTFLGAAALLTVPLRSLLDRTPPRLGLAVSFLLFLLVRDVNSGFLGFAGVPVLHLPQSWYASTLTTALGFPYPGFVSSDYFSLLPWLLLFWTGYHLYRLRPETPAGAYGHGPPFPCHLSAAPAGDLRPAGADLFLRRYLCLS